MATSFAPRPAYFPLSPEDLAIVERWVAARVQACATCTGCDLDHPINDRAIVYCTTRCIWTAPWDGRDCDRFTRREP